MNILPLQKSLRACALLLSGLGFLLAAPLRADLNSDLAFTSFTGVDINNLDGGAVLQKPGGLISFPRGIITQALYVVNAQPAQVQAMLIHWKPASHPELSVWLHESLPAHPTATDFSGLGTLPDNSSVNKLLTATTQLDAANPSLQVNKEEAQLIATAAAATGTDPKTLFLNSWSQILAGRVANFLAGKAGADHFVVSGGDIPNLGELKSLLHSDPKVYGQFQRFFNQTPLKSGSGSATRLVPADLYYECFDIEGAAALGTGAVYQAAGPTSIQSADFEYYINSGIYASIELEQMWPVTVNGKNETLVWREDLISAPNIAYLHGTERIASGMVMLQDVKQAIDAFRSEFK